jgi:predicted Zn-dependent peptidase
MLDRKTPPSFVAATTFTLPPAEKRTLSNGVDVLIVRDVKQEVYKLELLFEAGKWFEPQPGVSHFTAHLLEKGTHAKDSTEIAEAFDRLGAHVEISPGYDYSSISLYGLKKNWEEAFALFTEILREPTFSTDELELMKSIFVQSLKVNLEKNNFVASQLIRKNIFGSSHPYGSSLTEAEAMRLKPEQLKSFHEKFYQPFVILLTVGPQFDEREILSSLAQYNGKKSVAQPLGQTGSLQKLEMVNKEESSQTALRIGRRSLLKTDPDYVDFLMFNHLLGGYFGSRLMKNIREEKGLTYGIYSSLQSYRHDSLWMIGAEVNKENRELALTEITAEVNQMLQIAFPTDELETAKSHFLGSLQSEVANPFSVTDKIKNIYLHKLPSDFYSQLFTRVRSITAADILQVGNKHFSPESFSTVAVG